MNGIYPMAALTLVVGALSALAYLSAASGRGKSLWPLLLFGLPLSFLINRLVKGPLITGIMAWSGVSNCAQCGLAVVVRRADPAERAALRRNHQAAALLDTPGPPLAFAAAHRAVGGHGIGDELRVG